MPTILVVDDEPNIIEVLEIVLQDEGMEVLKSSSGQEALALLQENDVDLVISDIKMPDFSGVELLREAKQLSPDTVFIMITAFASTETAIEALQHGAYDYITKPFKMEDLRSHRPPCARKETEPEAVHPDTLHAKWRLCRDRNCSRLCSAAMWWAEVRRWSRSTERSERWPWETAPS